MCLLTVAFGMPKESAALRKPPASKTRAKTRMACNWSTDHLKFVVYGGVQSALPIRTRRSVGDSRLTAEKFDFLCVLSTNRNVAFSLWAGFLPPIPQPISLELSRIMDRVIEMGPLIPQCTINISQAVGDDEERNYGEQAIG